MADLYWRALLRDLPFRAWDTDPRAAAAAADLRSVGAPQLDATTLFRGTTAGEQRGPLISQFLWLDIPYGA
jgi:hypothetical protein